MLDALKKLVRPDIKLGRFRADQCELFFCNLGLDAIEDPFRCSLIGSSSRAVEFAAARCERHIPSRTFFIQPHDVSLDHCPFELAVALANAYARPVVVVAA